MSADAGQASARGRAKTVPALTAVVVGGQAVGLVDPDARAAVFISTLMLLDALGAGFSLRAARRSAFPAAWRISASGRIASVIAMATIMIATATNHEEWRWISTITRLAMFVLFSGGLVYVPIKLLGGRRRGAFLAKAGIVFGGGFMLVWYFILVPQLADAASIIARVPMIGFPVGDLLVLTAVSALILSGAVRGVFTPVTFFVAGLTLYVLVDAFMASVGPHQLFDVSLVVAEFGLLGSSILMTVAPMLVSAETSRKTARDNDTGPPLWSTALPMLALAGGGILLLLATVRAGALVPWGGLTAGLIVMITAVLAWQLIAGRDNRDLILSDALTGLTNRTGLTAALTRALRGGEDVAVLLIDLDDFKLVNDVYGHQAGDAVLLAFGHHLRACVRAGDVTCRLGGDEFVVLLQDVAEPRGAVEVAQRILAAATAHPVRVGDDLLPIRASIGLTTSRAEDTDRELLRRADVAMYQAKRAGTHTFAIYDSSMVDRRAEDAALSDDLDGALARAELHVVYQPLVALADGHPVAVETLIRWQHPVRGPISPMTFIPIAERSGAITAIGLWVLEQSCSQLSLWHASHPDNQTLYVSVNLSPRQLEHPTLVHDVLSILRRTNIAPRNLVLEVTESALVDSASSIEALRTLHEHGIRIAVDDFGTGYSSLHYLTKLPVDILKIDRSFVTELNGTTEGCAVTEAIIRLGHALRLVTVAEGIETEEQAAELQALGCDVGQGYLFSRPLPAGELRTLLSRQS